jgi:hypothetical protein
MKWSQIDRAVYGAVAYADVFGYPLNRGELAPKAVGVAVSDEQAVASLTRLVRVNRVTGRGEWVTLPSRSGIIADRKRRSAGIGRKLRLARRVAAFLAPLPTVLMVAVTGGVAAGNADAGDDVDLLIVASPGTVWTTRLIVTAATGMRFTRRHPGQAEIADAVCLNMFMDGGRLAVPVSERDVYSAHEVMQLLPVFSRGSTAADFWRENGWTGRYLPNWHPAVGDGMVRRSYGYGIPDRFVRLICRLAEPVAYAFQRWYMGKKVTSEVTKPDYVRFHPRDARSWVLPAFAERTARLDSRLLTRDRRHP